jgi:hypothetical protein
MNHFGFVEGVEERGILLIEPRRVEGHVCVLGGMPMAQSEVGCRGCCGCEYIGNRAWLQTHVIVLASLSLAAGMLPYHTMEPPCRAIAQYITDRRVYFATSLHAKGTSSHVSIHHRLHSQLRHIALVQLLCTSHAVGVVPLREVAAGPAFFLLLAMRRHVGRKNSPLTMSCVACPARPVVPYHHRQDACHVR